MPQKTCHSVDARRLHFNIRKGTSFLFKTVQKSDQFGFGYSTPQYPPLWSVKTGRSDRCSVHKTLIIKELQHFFVRLKGVRHEHQITTFLLQIIGNGVRQNQLIARGCGFVKVHQIIETHRHCRDQKAIHWH